MRRQALLASCLGQLMITLDVSVVNIALPSVRADFGLGAAEQQWVVTAYALPFAGFLLVGGRAADVFGVRAVFSGGMALFTAASVLAGISPGAELLLGGRVLQGLAAAFVAPATLTLITTAFAEGEPRTRALAWWTAMSIAGGTAGNLCGGVLTEFLGWRAVFLVNVPFGVVAMVLVSRVASRRGSVSRHGIDAGAAVLVTAALLVVAFGLSAEGEQYWAPGLGAFPVAAGFFLAFARRDRRAAEPLLPRALLAVPTVRWGNVGLLLAGAALVPMWFFLSLQLQVVLGYSPLVAGLAFLPHTVVQLIVGLRWTPRLLRRVAPSSLVTVSAGLLAVGFTWQSRLGPESDYATAVLLPAVFIAVGAGLLNLPLTTMTVAGVPDSIAGAASGVMNCAKQIGGGLGLTVLVAATARIEGPTAAYGGAFLGMAALSVVIGAGAVFAARAYSPGNGPGV